MISAGAPFEDWQRLLAGAIGTLRNAEEEPFMIAQDLVGQEYRTYVRQLPQTQLFTSCMTLLLSAWHYCYLLKNTGNTETEMKKN